MQRWGWGVNGIYKTCDVYLEEGPWWAWALGRIADVCLPRWRIPCLQLIPIVREGERTTVAQWYGETLDDFWHAWVTYPLFNFAYTFIKSTAVPLSWDFGKSLLYDQNPGRWDEAEADPEFGAGEGMTVKEYLRKRRMAVAEEFDE